jgi:hypothetical protein
VVTSCKNYTKAQKEIPSMLEMAVLEPYLFLRASVFIPLEPSQSYFNQPKALVSSNVIMWSSLLTFPLTEWLNKLRLMMGVRKLCTEMWRGWIHGTPFPGPSMLKIAVE